MSIVIACCDRRFILLTCEIYLYMCVSFFFFQAEDGIRDLVRSRGLGDVYKRQGINYRSIMVDQSRLILFILFINIPMKYPAARKSLKVCIGVVILML